MTKKDLSALVLEHVHLEQSTGKLVPVPTQMFARHKLWSPPPFQTCRRHPALDKS